MFQNNQEFLNAFDIANSKSYYDQVLLSDTKFGFSVKRNYPSNIAYKPILKQNGKPDTVAVLWVVLRETEKKKDGKILITVRISTFSLWGANHFDYSDDPESPTKEAIEANQKKPKPVELECRDNFYYDPVRNNFVDKKGAVYSGEAILDFVFKEHCDTADPIRGVELRIKQFVRKLCDLIFIIIISPLIWVLDKIFHYDLGHKESYYKLPISLTLYKFTDIRKREGEKLSLLGWSTHKETIVLFCVIVFVCSVGSYLEWWELKYFQHISKDNFLVITHAICALSFIEILPSVILYPLLNQIIKLRAKVTFSTINPFTYKSWLKPLIAIIFLGLIIYYVSA